MEPSRKKHWVITQEALDLLLARLDPDRIRAGQRYEKIRQQLIHFFKWRGCTQPAEYADQTIDRAARRLADGAELTPQEPYAYFHGIAINVLREYWKQPQREEALEDLPASAKPSLDPGQQMDRAHAQFEREQRLRCLDQCLDRLPPKHLGLITQYHLANGGLSKNRRKQLADALQIPLNALRIRAYRIRSAVENCVDNCLTAAAKG